jgi:Predicted membrane protein
MRKLKITLDTLNQELREKNIFHIDEVDYAILELNGKISVLRKPEYLPAIHKDLQLAMQTKQSFPVELIMDGQFIEDNMRQNGISKEWLNGELKSRGLTSAQVNYAVKSTNGQLYVDKYKDGLQEPIDKE